MESALTGLDRHTHLHASFDVDFLDPDIAPGVGTTVAGGPSYREAQLCMEIAGGAFIAAPGNERGCPRRGLDSRTGVTRKTRRRQLGHGGCLSWQNDFMEYRDYYRIMGLQRGATQDEIKRAYRKLARKYHPDVSKEKDAEQKFKELQEANNVLSDPEKRAAYDQLGPNWQQGQQFRPPPDWGRNFEFRTQFGGGGARFGGAEDADFSDFFANLFGGRSPFGRASAAGRSGRDHHARIDLTLEEAYRGGPRTLQLQRPVVTPDGQVDLRTHELRVTIPPGVTEGQQIRLAGQGEPASGPQGKAGDLYLETHILPHDRFQLDGLDVTITLPVAPWEAALGATVEAPTLGGPVELRIPPGARAGQKLRLRGRGLPGRQPGDEYAVLKIVLPPADSPRARELYEQMKRELDFNPRA